MKFRSLLVGLGACALSFLPWAASAQQPVVIKFSHVVAANTPKGKAADFFAAKAAELTKGRVKVEVYPNSTLYKDKEEIEALQLGSGGFCVLDDKISKAARPRGDVGGGCQAGAGGAQADGDEVEAAGAHQGSAMPSLRSMRARAINGRPTRALGSSPRSASSRVMPRPSDLALPAQSRGSSLFT